MYNCRQFNPTKMNSQMKLTLKLDIKTYNNFNQVFDFYTRNSFVQVAHIQQNSLTPRLAEPRLLNVFFFLKHAASKKSIHVQHFKTTVTSDNENSPRPVFVISD